MTKLFHSQLDSAQTLSVIAQGASFEREYPHVTYLNLFHSPLFPDSLFWNADHLNTQGAERLTLILDSIIENHILKETILTPNENSI